MERIAILIVLALTFSFNSFGQDKGTDSEKSEIKHENQGNTDSVITESGQSETIISNENENDDPVDYAPEGTVNDNDAGIALPSKATGNNPGPEGQGSYDVDGKVNGETDAKGQERQQSENSTRNPASGQP